MVVSMSSEISCLVNQEKERSDNFRVELGLLFTFVSMPEGGNDFMQICFRYFFLYTII
ncbi:hypothetical protein MKX03_010253, partial [Papaver bracteatum]